jgi:hypothetical protein
MSAFPLLPIGDIVLGRVTMEQLRNEARQALAEFGKVPSVDAVRLREVVAYVEAKKEKLDVYTCLYVSFLYRSFTGAWDRETRDPEIAQWIGKTLYETETLCLTGYDYRTGKMYDRQDRESLEHADFQAYVHWIMMGALQC